MTTATEERILLHAREKFFAEGFKKVTMDELSEELGMSKRTLYQYFPGKRSLLKRALFTKIDEISAGLLHLQETREGSFVGQLHALIHFMNDHLPRPGRAFLRDMERVTPEIWAEVDEARLRVLRKHFSLLFSEGVRTGDLNPGTNVEFLVHVLSTMVQQMVRPAILAALPMTASDLLEELVRILCLGVLSEEGRRRLNDRAVFR